MIRKRPAAHLLALLLLCSITAAAYLPAARAGWLLWDDASYVYRNQLVTSSNWSEQLRLSFGSIQCSNYHPLTMLSHALLWRVAGDQPLWHHAANILLHLLNGVLVYALLNALRVPAFLAVGLTGLFLLHPAGVPVVAWVSERKELMATFFYLAAMHAWVRGSHASRNRWLVRATVLVCGLAALLSKPTAVTLPVLLLLAAVLVRGRPVLGDWWVLIALSVAAAALAGVTLVAQSRSAIQGLAWAERLPLACHTFAWYAGHWLVPIGLSPHHPRYAHWLSWDAHAAIGAVLVAAAVAVAAWARRRAPVLALGLAWFLICWLPIAGIVPVGKAAVADRYLYLPQIGLLMAVGTAVHAGLSWACRQLRRGRGAVLIHSVAAGAMALVVGVAVVATRKYTEAWQDDESLWRWVLRQYPDSGLAWVNLGAYYAQRRDDAARARDCFRRARQTMVDGQQKLAALNLLLLQLARRPDDPGLLMALEQLLEQPPDADNRLVVRAIRDARAAAARAALRRGMARAALRHCSRGLRFCPDDPELMYLRGLCYAALGRDELAERAWREVIRNSRTPEPLRQLAEARRSELLRR